MNATELKQKIGKLKDAIKRINDAEDKDSMELQKAVDKLEKKLKELEEKDQKKEKKPQPKKQLKKKETINKPAPAKKKPLLKKALQQPKPKEITIKKDKKEEKHIITTSFGKDIEGAVLVLNKERYVIREEKDRKTGKVEKVKHSPEFKNAKLIQSRVDTIFKSSIHDIAKSPKERTEKKEVIAEAEAIRDLTAIWLNEVDILINNENVSDLAAIKKLMIGLIREARKNDPDDKYKLAGGLSKLVEKYNI